MAKLKKVSKDSTSVLLRDFPIALLDDLKEHFDCVTNSKAVLFACVQFLELHESEKVKTEKLHESIQDHKWLIECIETQQLAEANISSFLVPK